MGADEKLALVTLRTALDAVRVAEQACMAADFGNVHVLGPLERIRADLQEVVKVVTDGVLAAPKPEVSRLAYLRTLIADDSYAMTFQTFGQYRTALLKATDKLLAGGYRRAADQLKALHARGFVRAYIRAWARSG
jgi:hypothetical protein